MKVEEYEVFPSSNKLKKYDVFLNGKFVVSFGYRGMGQYKDKIGYYSHLDHNDEKRRKAYKSRFKSKQTSDRASAQYWSNKYLW